MPRRIRQQLAVLAVLALGWTGCGADGGSADGRLPIVATTTHAADLARVVGGDRVEVRGLLSPNSDPHDYEPRPSDARAVAEAAIVVRSGGELDEWLGDLIDGAGGGAERVTLIEHVMTIERDGGADPHWWQDPRNAIRAVEAIRDALAARDPEGARSYRERAAAYVERLRALDRDIAACVLSVPASQRKVVTTHDSLGYLAKRYGIEVVGAVIPALSSQAQPSAADTDRLVRQIREERVAAVFPESAVAPELERAIAREAGAEVGDALWADALGPAGSDGATYLDAMADNADALVRGMSRGAQDCQ